MIETTSSQTTIKIVAGLPTRGFIFAQSLISLQRNGVTDVCYVTGLTIPDCHNEATKQALAKGATHVLLYEEDMEMPDGTIEKMLEVNGNIVVVDYAIGDQGKWHCTYKKDGKILFGGTGCMLVRREVFERMPYPWFENDKTFDIKTWEPLDVQCEYGGQDVYFCYKARKMGIEIQEVPDWHCKHWRCKNLERVNSNDGRYTFFEIDYVDVKQVGK
jgi:GT2 family glycosyltransferase